MQSFFERLLWAALALSISTTADARLNVFACEPEWAALTRELAGDGANVFAATHAGQDPHYVQARPSLIARLRSADLAVCTGAELETGWMPMLQRRARNPKVLAGRPGYFAAAEHVVLLEVPGRLDRAEGDVHADGNPHIQLDPRRLLDVANTLSDRLQTLDPANAALYSQRLASFTDRWQTAMQRWETRAQPLRGKRTIVHHREWVYLLDWLGIQRTGSLEPKPGVPPTLAHLADLKQVPADMVIVSHLNDHKPAKWLQGQTAVPVVVLPHTVGAEPGADDLTGWFDVIITRLLGSS